MTGLQLLAWCLRIKKVEAPECQLTAGIAAGSCVTQSSALTAETGFVAVAAWICTRLCTWPQLSTTPAPLLPQRRKTNPVTDRRGLISRLGCPLIVPNGPIALAGRSG